MKFSSLFLIAFVALSVNSMQLLQADVGVVPITVDLCPESTGANLTNFQGTLNAIPKKATPLDLTITGTAIADITLTKVTLTASSMGVQLYTNDIPFDQTVSAGNDMNWKYSYPIPSFFPDGSYVIALSFKNGDDLVECGQTTVDFN